MLSTLGWLRISLDEAERGSKHTLRLLKEGWWKLVPPVSEDASGLLCEVALGCSSVDTMCQPPLPPLPFCLAKMASVFAVAVLWKGTLSRKEKFSFNKMGLRRKNLLHCWFSQLCFPFVPWAGRVCCLLVAHFARGRSWVQSLLRLGKDSFLKLGKAASSLGCSSP